jgi:hypothetical protein
MKKNHRPSTDGDGSHLSTGDAGSNPNNGIWKGINARVNGSPTLFLKKKQL